jgi:hypothetical protein
VGKASPLRLLASLSNARKNFLAIDLAAKVASRPGCNCPPVALGGLGTAQGRAVHVSAEEDGPERHRPLHSLRGPDMPERLHALSLPDLCVVVLDTLRARPNGGTSMTPAARPLMNKASALARATGAGVLPIHDAKDSTREIHSAHAAFGLVQKPMATSADTAVPTPPPGVASEAEEGAPERAV